MPHSRAKEVAKLQREVQALRDMVCSLVLWLATSANSPISRAEAQQLIVMVEGDDADGEPGA